jgi:flavin reductase (DIM6/NTAB) family NADH-FMN oxidoreductase RutF/rubredoxin
LDGQERRGIDRKALYTLSYGMYAVTARLGDRQNGQIANTAFQITSDPVRIAVSLNKNNLTHEYVAQGGAFGVSVLAQETPMAFIGLLGFKSGREVDKLAQVAHETGQTGCPLVKDHALAVLEARVVGQLDAGTHTVFLGEVVGAKVFREGTPLTYAYYHQFIKGHTPQSAPTHQPPAAGAGEEKKAAMKRYVCNVCGYVYDPEKGDPESGLAPGTPFEQIPESWVCPVCGAPQSEFSPAE